MTEQNFMLLESKIQRVKELENSLYLSRVEIDAAGSEILVQAERVRELEAQMAYVKEFIREAFFDHLSTTDTTYDKLWDEMLEGATSHNTDQ